jgi:hypothetical protein
MTGCGALPLLVTSTPTQINNIDAVKVVVTYQSALLIPIPGLLPGQLTIIGQAQMMVNPSADF